MKALIRRILAPLTHRTHAPRDIEAILTKAATPGMTPHECFSERSEETWFWALTDGYAKHAELRSILPGVPDEEFQATYTGSSGKTSLREGFNAYMLFKRLYEKHCGPIGECPTLLDFGCGWGRIIRFFLRDLPSSRLIGLDHSADAIKVCKETNPWTRFELIDPDPPTLLPDNSVNLIYLYSVFSHLPESMHTTLLKEFSRILRPGGLLIATTRRRDFITWCASLRGDKDLADKPDWLKTSAVAYPDTAAALASYDAGEFCYSNLGYSGRWSFWGEAAIPRAYVEKNWSQWFEFKDYIDDPSACPQDVIVVRKPS